MHKTFSKTYMYMYLERYSQIREEHNYKAYIMLPNFSDSLADAMGKWMGLLMWGTDPFRSESPACHSSCASVQGKLSSSPGPSDKT